MRKPSDLAQITKTINATMQERGAKRIPRDLAAQLRAEGLKRCSGCKTVLPRDQFGAHTKTADGLQGYCRACNRSGGPSWIEKGQARELATFTVEHSDPEKLTTEIHGFMDSNGLDKAPSGTAAQLLARGLNWCGSCRTVKPAEEFSGNAENGYYRRCNPCRCASARERARAAAEQDTEQLIATISGLKPEDMPKPIAEYLTGTGRSRLPERVRSTLAGSDLRWCSTCETVKPVSGFTGDRPRCRECTNARDVERYWDTRPDFTVTHEEPERLTEEINHWLGKTGRTRITPSVNSQLSSVSLGWCNRCSTVQSASSFHSSSDRVHNRFAWCSDCANKHGADYYDLHRDEINSRLRERRVNDPAWAETMRAVARERQRAARESDRWYHSVLSGRRRARRAGVPCEYFTGPELMEHWISKGIDPGRCTYTGVELTEENFSIDHVTPLADPNSPGHVLSNCVPADRRTNVTIGNQRLVDWLADRAAEQTDEQRSRLPELVKQALEPTVPSRTRRTLMLTTATVGDHHDKA